LTIKEYLPAWRQAGILHIMMKNKSFTLLELIVVIIIIGVLATLGVAHYRVIQEQASGQEAVANLILIANAERIFRMENGFYYPSPAATQTAVDVINTNLRLTLNERVWDYWITTTGVPTGRFTVFSDRQGAGGFLDCQYSINETQTRPIQVPGTTCAYIPTP
jgi:prepilin-type N-terminal cleavage/methylation domain-containing protein